MKIFVFLTILCIVSAQKLLHLVPAHIICLNVTGDQDILLPNPIDCSIYYRCENGMAVPQSCPKGLQWCQVLTKCTLPILANCTINYTLITYSPEQLATYTPYPSTENVTSLLPAKRICPIDGATIPSPYDCNTYYLCENGVPVSRNCPIGEQYSSWNEICYPGIMANCVNSDFGNKTGNLCLNDISIPNIANCSTYYKCYNGVVDLKTCDAGLTYSPWNRVCRNSTECEKYLETSTANTITFDITTVSNPNLPDFNSIVCPFDGAKLPDPFDCNSYFICQIGEPTKLQCPFGSQYSCWDQICESNVTVICINSNSGNQTGLSCNYAKLTMPNIQDCTTYYKCLNGRVKLVACSAGLTYNPWLGSCSKDDVCKSYLIQNTTSLSTTSPTFESTTNKVGSTENTIISTPPVDIETTKNYINTTNIASENITNPISKNNTIIVTTGHPIDTNTTVKITTNTVSPITSVPTIISTITIPINRNSSATIPANTNITNNVETATSSETTISAISNPSTIGFNTISPETISSETYVTTTNTASTSSESTIPTTIVTTSSSDITTLVTALNPEITNSTISTNPITIVSETIPENTINTIIVTASNPVGTNTSTIPTTTLTTTSPENTNNTTIVTTTNPDTIVTASVSENINSTMIETTISTIPTTIVTKNPDNTNNTTIDNATSPKSTNITTIVTASIPESTSNITIFNTASPDSANISTIVTASISENVNSTIIETTISTIPTTIVTTNPDNTNKTTIENAASPESTNITSIVTASIPESTNISTIVTASIPESTNSTIIETTISKIPTTIKSTAGREYTNNTVTAASSDSVNIATTLNPENTITTTSPSIVNTSNPPNELNNSTETSTNPVTTTEITANSTTSISLPNILCPIDDILYPSSRGDCHAYMKCISGQLLELKCNPVSYNYNCATEQCENITECCATNDKTTSINIPITTGPLPSTVRPILNLNSTSKKPINILCPIDGILYPSYLGDCHGYMMCKNGQLVQMKCEPPTFNYNCLTELCENITHCCATGGSISPSTKQISTTKNPSTTTTVTSPSVDNNICQINGTKLPNPIDCTSYYECQNNNPILQKCSEGEEYSCWDQACKSSDNSTCIKEGSQQGNTCSNEGEPNAKLDDCSSYYKCTNGKIEIVKCASGTFYNSWFKGCYNFSLAWCQTYPIISPPSTIQPPPSTSSPSPTSNICPMEGAKLPNVLDCSSYYVCLNGIPTIQYCPGYEIYSCWEQDCLPITEGQCISFDATTKGNCSIDGLLLPNINDCSSYYECSNNSIAAVQCSDGMMYNSWFKKCTQDKFAYCQTVSTPANPLSTFPDSIFTVSPAPNICPVHGIQLPDPTNCAAYYICQNGLPISQKCPDNEEYSCWDQNCETSSNSICITNGNQEGQKCSIEGKMLPNIADCSSFYICINGKVELHICAGGAIYSEWFKMCLNATLFGDVALQFCKTFPTLPPITLPQLLTTTISPSIGRDLCPVNHAFIPNSVDCSTYYECINYTPVLQNCPFGMKYSCWEQKCMNASDATCITSLQTGANCSKETMKLADITHCGKYYQCKAGRVILRPCLMGLQFNNKYQKCMLPEFAHCETYSSFQPVINETTSIPVTLSPTDDVCPNDGILLPNPVNCNTYYQCVNGTPVLQICAVGLQFSCWDMTCLPPENAKCMAIGIHVGQFCSINGQMLQNPNDCQSYYQCINNSVVLKPCPFNGYYNKWFHVCVPFAKLAHCQQTPIVTTRAVPTRSSIQPQILNVCPENGAALPNPTDCNSYYKCINNTPVVQRCPDDEEYNCWDQTCQLADVAQCISIGSQVGETCSREGVRLPNPESCNSFYECHNGKVELIFCFLGLEYNKWFEKCTVTIYSHCRTYTTMPVPEPIIGPSTEVATTVEYTNSDCPQNGVKIPNPNDCHTYFVCENSVPVLHSCPDNSNYDCWSEKCDLAILSRCVYTPQAYVGELCFKEGETVPKVDDCSKFYVCQNGIIAQKSCPLLQQYSVWGKKCMIIGLAKCANNNFLGII